MCLQLSRGCFNVITADGLSTPFCSDRDVFSYLVANYCNEIPDGLLPKQMGGLAEYPPGWWMTVAWCCAGLGVVFVLWALFYTTCCSDPDGCVALNLTVTCCLDLMRAATIATRQLIKLWLCHVTWI